GGAAQPAVPGAVAARGPAPDRVPVCEALHQLAARDPGAGAAGRAGRGVAGGHRYRARLLSGMGTRGGRRAVDRRVRPDLRDPGRRGGPADRGTQRAGAVRGAVRAGGLVDRARGDVRAVRLVRRAGRAGAWWWTGLV